MKAKSCSKTSVTINKSIERKSFYIRLYFQMGYISCGHQFSDLFWNMHFINKRSLKFKTVRGMWGLAKCFEWEGFLGPENFRHRCFGSNTKEVQLSLVSAPVHAGPGAHPASFTMSTGSFPGVKQPGRGGDYTCPSSAEVKERVKLYLYSPSGPSLQVTGWNLTCTFT